MKIKCTSDSSNWCSIAASTRNLIDGEEIELDNISHNESVMHFKWLHRTNLESIPPIIFKTFPELWDLQLSTGLQALQKTNFTNAKKLSHLSLQKNLIRNLTEGVFSEASNLISIDLSGNRIRVLEDFALKNLDKLEYLNLENNLLTTLTHDALKGAPALLIVNFNDNRLSSIEPGAFDLQHLKKVVLGNNRLTTLPSDLFSKAPSLVHIDLINNDFIEIPSALWKSPTLRTLNLDWNYLESVSLAEFAKLKSLRSLSLIGCDLRTVSWPTNKELSASNSLLKSLDLSNNELSDWELLFKLHVFKNLETLLLDENNIIRLALSIERHVITQLLPNITSISLKKNKIDCDWIADVLPKLKPAEIDIESECESD